MQDPKTRDFIRKLREQGYDVVRTTGGHAIYSNGQRSIPVPVHNVTVNGLLARRIFKEISKDEAKERDAQGKADLKSDPPCSDP